MTLWARNLPAMQETQKMRVRSLGQEYALEKGMATLCRILVWGILWTEEFRQATGHRVAESQI